MREIKFRAWMPEIKQWQTKENVDWCPIKGLLENKVGYMWSQYAGLKDKHGKEIYEGDKLVYKQFTVPDHKGHWHVEWNAYFWDVIRHFPAMYEGDKGEGCFEGQDFLWRYHDYMEIIGNKYENPELLKEVKTNAGTKRNGKNKH